MFCDEFQGGHDCLQHFQRLRSLIRRFEHSKNISQKRFLSLIAACDEFAGATQHYVLFRGLGA